MLLVALTVAAATPARLPPVDQCSGDPGFAEFRAALSTAVRNRDLSALPPLMADDIRLSFGGRYGKQQFVQEWAGAARSAELWAELDDALKLGCAAKQSARVFPSMFAQADGLDGFETWIARPGARLRSKPSLDGKVKATLAWHVLHEDGAWNGGEWIGVRLADGRRGFVHRTAARSPIGYRLVVQKRDGRWQITAFIAGD